MQAKIDGPAEITQAEGKQHVSSHCKAHHPELGLLHSCIIDNFTLGLIAGCQVSMLILRAILACCLRGSTQLLCVLASGCVVACAMAHGVSANGHAYA